MDVILASNQNLVRGTKIISDHDLVYVVLKLGKERPKPVYIKTRSFKNYIQEAFLQDFSQVPWSAVDCSDDVKDSLNAFNLLFKEVLDGHAPEERYRTKDLFISDSFVIAVI